MKDYVINENVKIHKMDNSLYIINFSTGVVSKLSSIASYILKHLEHGLSKLDMIDDLTCKYQNMSREQIAKDIDSTILNFLKKEIIYMRNKKYDESITHIEATTLGNSMFPIINDNSKINIEHSLNTNVKNEDIVAFSYGDKVILHRLLAHNEEYFATQGDNNFLYDRPVKKDCLIGILQEYSSEHRTNIIRNQITINETFYDKTESLEKELKKMGYKINNELTLSKNKLNVIMAPTLNKRVDKISTWDFYSYDNEINLFLISNYSDVNYGEYKNVLSYADVILPFYNPLQFFEMDIKTHIITAINCLGMFAFM